MGCRAMLYGMATVYTCKSNPIGSIFVKTMSGHRGRKSWNVANAFIHSFNDLQDVKDGTSPIRWRDLKMAEFESNPYGYIQVLYNRMLQLVPKPHINDWQLKLLMGLHLKYLERRIVKNNFDTILSLNSHDTTKVKNGQVVTFRCMIQDEVGPEFNSAEYVIENPVTGETTEGSTLLKDYLYQGDFMEGFSHFNEKDVYVAVTPPAENFWVSQPQEDDDDCDLPTEKKTKLDKSSKDKTLVALPNYRDIFPSIFTELGETKPMACRLKIYRSDNDNMKFRTNDVIQVIGLIQLPGNDSNPNVAGNDAAEELELRYSPSEFDKLPVLHVFSAIHLAFGNPNVLWLDVKAFPLLKVSNIDVDACAGTLRDLLSLGLGGDRFAALYAMMAMVAVVHYPDESSGIGTSPIGKYILNVSGVPETSDVAELFTKIVKALTPRTIQLDFAIENINKARLVPTKNLETNVLETALLQLPNGTQMIIDETKLNEGKFEDHGCRNLIVLKDLLNDKEVKYNYTYQHPSIQANFPTTVLSTSASVLPHDIRVHLKYVPAKPMDNRRASIDTILKEKAELLRYYITLSQLIVKHSHYGFDESDPQLQEDMTDYLVDRNRSELYHNKMTPHEFASFVTSCRLWCVLHGHSNQITRESFMAMRDMERIRDGRIPKSTN